MKKTIHIGAVVRHNPLHNTGWKLASWPIAQRIKLVQMGIDISS